VALDVRLFEGWPFNERPATLADQPSNVPFRFQRNRLCIVSPIPHKRSQLSSRDGTSTDEARVDG